MSDDLSQDPIDVLLRRVAIGQSLSRSEMLEVRRHVAAARFGLELESAHQHLTKRTEEGQWSYGTTVDECVGDLRYIVATFSSAMLVYRRRGGVIASFIGLTRLLPPGHLGRAAAGRVLVVYSADRGIVITGYQFEDLDEISIPGDARWFGRLP